MAARHRRRHRVTIGDIERQFGAAVAKIVGELTPVSLPGHGTRAARFAIDRQHFARASAAAKTVKIADLIDTCRDLHKSDPASLGSYAAEARELAQVLEGGDTRLLDKLKRDLQRYNLAIATVESAGTAAKVQPTALPITALQVFERAFTAQEIAEALLSFDFDCSAKNAAAAMVRRELWSLVSGEMDWYAGSLRRKVWVKAPAKRSEGSLRRARWSLLGLL